MIINAIATKIKIIGALLSISMLSIILITIYLNKKNIEDSKVINLSGQLRMLSQKISKNIIYIYYNRSNYDSKIDFSILHKDINIFKNNIEFLKNHNKFNIIAAPKDSITKQLFLVEELWNNFINISENFKNNISKVDISIDNIKQNIDEIYNTNLELLEEINNLVGLYEKHNRLKTDNILKFQYISAIIMFLLMIYSLFQLKIIETHAKEFIKYSKKLLNFDNKCCNIEPIDIEAESEIQEVSYCLNTFIYKINEAMDDSNEAISHYLSAAKRLENITDEFNVILFNLENSKAISNNINASEDIVIESTDELIKSTKRLQNLKNKLDDIIRSCNNKLKY